MGKVPFWVLPAAIILIFASFELVVMFLQALLILPTGTGTPGW
ncbi:hypothetical protein Ade02nite_88920 [Paractinoplanes deccanensis]|uniref:Uncharacterized protein n=1 Tax=Paractinoplanes deccanensis TaxID=113561 RepID=A0ABQ3YJR6_9ACTN|nr:hypothetical protein [Actinoplanes deccanensis]GID80251.1 hypothetical protein Ade02nite_88920 [Actinoplanes deccanensis]